MRYTWDPVKAEKNWQKHGVTFEQAKEAFDDPRAVRQESYYIQDDGEQRYHVIGMTAGLKLLLVIYAEPDSEMIRIISARRALAYEESIYEDYNG
jgi:uncharacterized DUF497 family protein